MMTTIKNNKSCKHETFIQNKVNLTCMQKVETQKYKRQTCNVRVFYATLAILVWKVLIYVMVEKSKRKAFGEHVSISDWWISFYCVGQLNELKFYAMSALG